jgi:hypothetical protein
MYSEFRDPFMVERRHSCRPGRSLCDAGNGQECPLERLGAAARPATPGGQECPMPLGCAPTKYAGSRCITDSGKGGAWRLHGFRRSRVAGLARFWGFPLPNG